MGLRIGFKKCHVRCTIARLIGETPGDPEHGSGNIDPRNSALSAHSHGEIQRGVPTPATNIQCPFARCGRENVQHHFTERFQHVFH